MIDNIKIIKQLREDAVPIPITEHSIGFNKGIEQAIERLQESEPLPEDIGRTIIVSWSIEDVISQAKERDINLSEQQAIEILARVDHSTDATTGINWDTIDYEIDKYLKDMSKG